MGSIRALTEQGFIAAQGFFAAQGLHGLRFPARGAQGIQGAAVKATGMPIVAANNPETIAVRSGLVRNFIMLFLSLNEA